MNIYTLEKRNFTGGILQSVANSYSFIGTVLKLCRYIDQVTQDALF